MTARCAALCVGAALLLAACSDELAIRELPLDVSGESGEPHLALDAEARPVLSWVESAEAGFDEAAADGAAERTAQQRLRFSRLEHGRWSVPRTVAHGSDWFVNWADVPSVVPIDAGYWLAHWLVRGVGNPYAYDVYLAISRDAGMHWGPPLLLHHDGTPSEHGFVSIYRAAADRAGVVWLDGRRTVDGGAMTLRASEIDSAGAPGTEHELDERVCDCCQTDAAVSAAGPLVVYRDRSPEEIRDISMVIAGERGWSAPRSVAVDGWRIEGCPVNGPAVAARGSLVAVAWYTGAHAAPSVRLVRSSDAGLTFTAPTDIAADAPLGRVDLVLADDGAAVVGWMARVDGGAAEYVLARVAPDGAVGARAVALRTAANRPSGFPRIAWTREGVVVAWTDVSADPARLRTLLVPLAMLAR